MIPDIDTLLAPFADAMSATRQASQWHGEGDVLTHTHMVCDALQELSDYQCLPEDRQNILLTAAALHDIGKIRTTAVTSEGIDAPHHAPTGSRMAREYLWKELNLCGIKETIQLRECLCLLIRYHSFPVHAIDNADATRRLHAVASAGLLVPDFTIRMLCILAKADIMGRKCADKQYLLDQVAMCEELAIDEECFDSPYAFCSNHTRRAFLSGCDVWKEQNLFDNTRCEVIMLSGLPGTGKDTWIARNLPFMPVVSLDDIRRREHISPIENQGIVANMAKESARVYLRARQSFVWNATNLSDTIRRPLIELFESYGARVRIIYLETDEAARRERNTSRSHSVPETAVTSMMGKLILPLPSEAHTVEWLTV